MIWPWCRILKIQDLTYHAKYWICKIWPSMPNIENNSQIDLPHQIPVVQKFMVWPRYQILKIQDLTWDAKYSKVKIWSIIPRIFTIWPGIQNIKCPRFNLDAKIENSRFDFSCQVLKIQDLTWVPNIEILKI